MICYVLAVELILRWGCGFEDESYYTPMLSFCYWLNHKKRFRRWIYTNALILLQQQQQQHNLLSQASWDRLEMKPKRNKDKRNTKKDTRQKVEIGVNRNKGLGSGMLIASFQALLSIANYLKIFHSLRSLLTNVPQFNIGRPLPLFNFVGLVQTTLSRISSFRTLSHLVCPLLSCMHRSVQPKSLNWWGEVGNSPIFQQSPSCGGSQRPQMWHRRK